MIKWKLTNRLFVKGDFHDDNYEECSIQVSSSIEPKIWLGINENRMHLNIEQIKKLIPILQNFVNEKYLYWDDTLDKQYNEKIKEIENINKGKK